MIRNILVIFLIIIILTLIFVYLSFSNKKNNKGKQGNNNDKERIFPIYFENISEVIEFIKESNKEFRYLFRKINFPLSSSEENRQTLLEAAYLAAGKKYSHLYRKSLNKDNAFFYFNSINDAVYFMNYLIKATNSFNDNNESNSSDDALYDSKKFDRDFLDELNNYNRNKPDIVDVIERFQRKNIIKK